MPKRQCRSKSRQTGKQCKRYCSTGHIVCWWHGAGTPNVQRAAVRRANNWYAKKMALRMLETAGYERIDDPVEALAHLAGEVWAAKEFFRSKIDELRYQSATGEQLRSEVALYERALDRCMKVLDVMARLNISDRRTEIAEQQAVMIASAVQRMFDRLGLTYRQQQLAMTIVPEELRAITAAPAHEPWQDHNVGLDPED